MKTVWEWTAALVCVFGPAFTLAQAPVERLGSVIDLPSSKQIHGVIPGGPQRLNSLPVTLAVSPDGRWVVSVNGGYGSFESGYMQSLAVFDTHTGKVVDYPDARTVGASKQVLFSGLAFSKDGCKLYGTIVSASDPEGKKASTDTGSGIQVYTFMDGKITPERVIKIPLQKLAAGRKTKLVAGGDGTLGMPYPASLAVAGAGNRLLVADNLSDDVLLMNLSSGEIVTRFDLSENDAVPSTYPIAVTASKDGKRAFVALWNASEVAELDLATGKVGRKLPLLKPEDAIAPGSHPTALALAPDGQTLYAALGNRDAVAAIDLSDGGYRLKGYFDARLPGQSFYGAQPEALALNADGSRLYVADMGADAVAVIDPRKLTKGAVKAGMVEPQGFVPTEWLPMGVVTAGGKLYVATGKGTGTGPNNFAQRPTPETANNKAFLRTFTYIPTLLHGSLAAIDETAVEHDLKSFTQATLEDNRMKAAEEKIAWAPQFANGGQGPIKHVIYIIKENRTYDQLFGDLQVNGQRVGNGDSSLTMYGEDITPNQHKLRCSSAYWITSTTRLR